VSLLWGIDLGGTKLEGVVVDSNSPSKPLARLRVATEAAAGYQHIIEQFQVLVLQMQAAVGDKPQCIGVGTSGILDPKTRVLKNSNTNCLNGHPLRQDLERALACEVRLANDANCFALAEAKFGAGREVLANGGVCFGVIMGTGVGGGIVIDDRVHNGCHGIAGEWGHNILVTDGILCKCGKRGCIERYISGPELEKFYLQRSGTPRLLPEIAQRSRAGSDEHASATIERLLKYYGEALSTIINILDPDVIVLGGGVSNVTELYSAGFEKVRMNLFNDRFETVIVPNKLGDSAGVFGAALLGG